MKTTAGDYWDQKRKLCDKIDAISDRNQSLIDAAEREDRAMTAAEIQEFESGMTDLETHKNELGTLHAQREAMLATVHAQREAMLAATPPSNLDLSQHFNGATIEPISQRHKKMSTSVHHRIGPLKAFKGPEAAKDAFVSGQWFKAVAARSYGRHDDAAEAYARNAGFDIHATATEGVPAGGGYLVPTPLANAIIDVREAAGVSRQICRVVPMTSETLKVPKKTAGTTVYYPGEAGTITASDQTWAQVNLQAVKRAILSKVSQELKDDSIISVMDDLASQMGTDFAVKEDAELINGDGTATYGSVSGVLDSIGTAGVVDATTGNDTWEELTIEDHTRTMAKLPQKYWPFSPVWVCSPAYYYTTMLRLLGNAGGNKISDVEQGSGRPMFLGYPVYFSNAMPTATAVETISALFGAFTQGVMIGERTGINIAQSEHLNFAEDLIALRATTRYDINVHEPGDGTDAGAYVGLKTAA